MERRDFLKSSAVLGTSALAGCCATNDPIPRATAQLVIDDHFATDLTSFLAPPNYTASPDLKPVPRIVDPHVHIYNASDWQIAGALTGPFASGKPLAMQIALEVIASAVEKVTQELSLSAADELNRLNGWEALGDTGAARQQADDYAVNVRDQLVLVLAREITGTPLENLINDILAVDQNAFTAPGPGYIRFSEQFLNDVFIWSLGSHDLQLPSELPSAVPILGPDDAAVADAVRQIRGVLGFLYHMVSPRYKNLMVYQDAFSADNTVGVDQIYASMLDFDYWIGDCDHAVSRLEDQVLLMARISQLSRGYLQPIAAYNPWTDIEDNDDSIDLVVRAITQHEFRGVKIYNQLGYYPNENASRFVPPVGKHPNLGLLDEKLRYFFTVCKSLEVPVMAHSGDSMGRTVAQNVLGGPAAWKVFFEAAENKGVRVNLAHMGGDKDGPNGTDWTASFVLEVMQLDGANYLYGDFGMWTAFAADNAGAVSRMVDLLSVPVSHNETAADRFMFGTDWLMLSAEGSWNKYASQFIQTLQPMVDQDTLEKIMYRNAEKLFTST